MWHRQVRDGLRCRVRDEGGHDERYVLAVSRPYLRSRPYSCVRVRPRCFAAFDLLPCILCIICSIILRHASHGILVAEHRRDVIGERLDFLEDVVAVGLWPAR